MTEFLLVALGASVAVDGTSVGQFMISRPLVAASLAGWIVGNPWAGLVVGGILEMIHLGVLPVGGVRFPEIGPGAVVAGALAAGVPTPGGVAVATLVGMVWAQVAGSSVTILRKINGRYVPRPEQETVRPRDLELVHMKLIGLDAVRGAVLVAVGLVVGSLSVGLLAGRWPLERGPTLAVLVLGAAAPLGALLKRTGEGNRTRTVFVVGVALGLLLSAVA